MGGRVTRFGQRLLEQLESFNYLEAYKLSQEIHKAEESGYRLSVTDDLLWEELTARIGEYEEKLSNEPVK